MEKTKRKGAIGALLDIYAAAINDLKNSILGITDKDLIIITDPLTTDENCKSVQAILSHVVASGYGYAATIHHARAPNIERPAKIFHTTIKEYLADLDEVFTYTETIFKEINDNELEQSEPSLKLITGWGQLYDIEQLTEHAIVHILRHTRQIEKIKWLLLK